MGENASKPTRVVVIDNGAIAVDDAGRHHVNRHTGSFVAEIGTAGVLPTFISPPVAYDRNSQLYDFCLQDHQVVSRPLPASLRRNPARFIAALMGEIRKHDMAYIFFPGTLGRAAALACIAQRRPYALYVRGSRFGLTGIDRIILANAAFALTVSPSIESQIRPLNANVDVIRPMINLSPADAFDRPRLARMPQRWELLFVGRLEVDKGINELLAAAQALRAKGLSFRMRLVGGGPMHSELERRLETETLGQHVELLGLVSDRAALTQLYRSAHLFILPTYHEGFPRVLYEAMIAALPIVTTMVGGIPGRMIDNRNCVGIAARSSEAIVAAVEDLCGNVAKLEALGFAGQSTVLHVLTGLASHQELFVSRMRAHAR